jgi:transcriptional regulator with GAF, ATPase, and Fis domain
MRSRCNDPGNTSYRNYGARGIKVCERYDSYENFLADKGKKPPGRELDRIDLDGDYTPENTRWIPAHSGFKRNSIIVNLEGRAVKLTEAAKELGLDYFALYNLMHRKGLSFQKAVDKLRKK